MERGYALPRVLRLDVCNLKEHLGTLHQASIWYPHAGHSSFFQDRTGRWYATMFGNDRTAPFRTGAGMVPLHLIDTNDDLIIEPGGLQRSAYLSLEQSFGASRPGSPRG